ncbi:MAG TPA: SRPBCC family protein [Pyrinomonadaceae bacterium]|jgi:ribosome-associated toxin RatA of RatAB toxin-antitoxin module
MQKTTTVERLIQASPEQVYEAYWKLGEWPLVLPNILEARADYDDDVHQYFTMVADKGGQRETVRGVRIGTPYRKLEMCQFQAPPGFLLMRGEWRFEPVENGSGLGTKVIAERIFAMEDASGEAAAASMLSALLAENLLAFDKYLTGKLE